jgi:hypothetical protein
MNEISDFIGNFCILNGIQVMFNAYILMDIAIRAYSGMSLSSPISRLFPFASIATPVLTETVFKGLF